MPSTITLLFPFRLLSTITCHLPSSFFLVAFSAFQHVCKGVVGKVSTLVSSSDGESTLVLYEA